MNRETLRDLVTGVQHSIARSDHSDVVRRSAWFASHFLGVADERQASMIDAEPPRTGDRRWDAFFGALGEWLAVRAGIDPPRWVSSPDRYLDSGWWVSPMRSLEAWEWAGSPASFKVRGVFIHRDSLTNV